MNTFDLESFSIIGYPKTGNTWVHQIVSSASNVEWNEIYHTHGMDHYNLNNIPFDKMELDLSVHLFRKKLIIVTRNLGDVLVSLYMHNMYREEIELFNGTLDEMVDSPIYGANKYLLFHEVLSNVVEKSLVETMILRYEELLCNDALIFNFLNFIGINDKALIEKAILKSRFESMKYSELHDEYAIPTLKRSVNWQKTNNSFKVRNGINYDYVNHFSKENVEYIKIRMKEMPEIFGYKGYNFPCKK